MVKSKGLIIAGVAVTAALGASKIYEYKRLSDKIEVSAQGMIHSLNLEQIVLKIDVEIKNPTDTPIKLRHPYLVFEYNNKKFASSEIRNTVYKLDRNSPVSKASVLLTLSNLKLLTTAPELLAEIRNKGRLEFQAKVSTVIEGIWNIPVEQTVPITINAPGTLKKT